jgi:hypothetical protein
MKNIAILSIFAMLAFISGLAAAQNFGENDSDKLPPGMEVMKVGKADLIVPKGTRMRREAGVIMLESINEYVARKISEIEKKLDRIQAEQERMKKQIEELSQK